MIIKYVHSSEPTVFKTYDTVKALKNNPFINMSQHEFDEHELRAMKTDKHIITFEIIKEN